ncbi:DUF5060 domain-containing protein [candidate division KSB1 bacterium]|nr:DUF5060 domain-containing protein [candidate division KSB1 bacterium]
MSFRLFIGALIFIIVPILNTQTTGWVEDFNDYDLAGWQVSLTEQRTYQLAAVDSALRIQYTRTADSEAWDNFNFTPPQSIDVSGHPYLRLRVRSDVAAKLSLKPVYTTGQNDWLDANLSAGDAWTYFTFKLYACGGGLMNRIYLYLDGGSMAPSSGTVYLDDLLISGDILIIHVQNLAATAMDTGRVRLTWTCDRPGDAGGYRIYRSQVNGFLPSVDTYLATSPIPEHVDATALQNRVYYYRVTAVDRAGIESLPSDQVLVKTPEQGLPPIVAVQSANASQVGLYEKYEIVLSLDRASYNNPFDYTQLNLRACFTSPTGRQWDVPGFYDNYQNCNRWKIRFAPNEIGQWQYVVRATDMDGTGESAVHSFTAVASDHHGWLHVSPDNPHYFIHDDGASFYGVAAYYPWRINNGSSGLALLEASGGNMFGYWNVTYDDGTLIESLSSGIGRYDQNKCNRIDTIIEWAEQRNMVMMLAIWPHDLFCQNLAGWAALWNQNPYKTVCSVYEIYEDETAWQYQEKQYRYIIARWGYSRGLGIWEIMNEISGTDAWVQGRIPQAEEWNRKVHQFLHDHDPFNRPTTSSMHGGHYWYNGYAAVDVSNVHMYETGWPGKFNGNPMRSSYWTYYTVTQQMWNDFAKPAIIGEAGWLDSYGKYAGGTDEYAMMYHNALWASWAGGLACTPVWWSFDPRVMESKVLGRMKRFAEFVGQVDYAYHQFTPAEVTAADADGFAMSDGGSAFGWIRDASGYDISNRSVQISGLKDTVYSILWYDTWGGEIVATHIRPATAGILQVQTPTVQSRAPDLVFKIDPTEIGEQPYRLELQAEPKLLFSDGKSQSDIRCFIYDHQDRFCSNAQTTVLFTLQGPGKLLGANPVQTRGGVAAIILQSDSLRAGMSTVTAAAAGLVADTVRIECTDVQKMDDFEAYGSTTSLQGVWRAVSGTHATVDLVTNVLADGKQGMRVQYTIGDGSPPYAGVFRYLPKAFAPSAFLRFWFKPDNSSRDLVIQFKETSTRYWSYTITMNNDAVGWVEVPLNQLQASGGGTDFNLAKITTIVFNITIGCGTNGSGEIYFDELLFTNSILTGVEAEKPAAVPQTVRLWPNQPNPFNPVTDIPYYLPRATKVNLSIYNLCGQKVETLVDSMKQAGNHRVHWNAGAHPSGTYFYVLRTSDRVLQEKCVLLR